MNLWLETEIPVRLKDEDYMSDYYYQQLISEYYAQQEDLKKNIS